MKVVCFWRFISVSFQSIILKVKYSPRFFDFQFKITFLFCLNQILEGSSQLKCEKNWMDKKVQVTPQSISYNWDVIRDRTVWSQVSISNEKCQFTETSSFFKFFSFKTHLPMFLTKCEKKFWLLKCFYDILTLQKDGL